MATCKFFDIDTMKEVQLESASRSGLLSMIEKVEKKNFPSSEAFDFTNELKKRNTELIVYLDHASVISCYAVFNRIGKIALLHKVLVLEQYRRQGIASKVLRGHFARLERHGCTVVQLWVDETREPARKLYQSLGFEEVDRMEDYYSLGRTGIMMRLSLSQ